MIPVDQTIFGRPDGNCFAACVASLLHLPIEQVPNFCAGETGWFYVFQDWLRERGLAAMCVGGPPHPRQLKGVYCIVSGMAERGLLHSTVWRGAELVHDPHPSRAGLLAPEDTIILIPLDVHAFAGAPFASGLTAAECIEVSTLTA